MVPTVDLTAPGWAHGPAAGEPPGLRARLTGMRTLSVLVLTLGLTLLAGCGDTPPPAADSGSGAAPESASPSPTRADPLPLPDDPTAPTGKPGSTTTVVGVVAAGVEAGCLVLETGSETLLLLDVRAQDAPEGARLRVTGSREPDLMTTCQQGTPFRVVRAVPAD